MDKMEYRVVTKAPLSDPYNCVLWKQISELKFWASASEDISQILEKTELILYFI